MDSLNKRLAALKISNDESNRLTRESIQSALLYLLKQKKLVDITVTEIVLKGGVSRAAFYKNYKNKEDVLFDSASNIIDTLTDSLNDEYYKKNHLEWFRFFYTQVKANHKILALLIYNNIDFSDIIITYKPIDNIEAYKIIALKKGLKNVMVEWINRGAVESIDYMAKLSYDLFDKCLDVILKG